MANISDYISGGSGGSTGGGGGGGLTVNNITVGEPFASADLMPQTLWGTRPTIHGIAGGTNGVYYLNPFTATDGLIAYQDVVNLTTTDSANGGVLNYISCLVRYRARGGVQGNSTSLRITIDGGTPIVINTGLTGAVGSTTLTTQLIGTGGWIMGTVPIGTIYDTGAVSASQSHGFGANLPILSNDAFPPAVASRTVDANGNKQLGNNNANWSTYTFVPSDKDVQNYGIRGIRWTTSLQVELQFTNAFGTFHANNAAGVDTTVQVTNFG